MKKGLWMLGKSKYGVAGAISKAVLPLVLLTTPVVAQETTILALGDSLTHGYGLQLEDGFVPQLEGWLKDRGADVAIINGGVSGDTTAGGLARVEWSLTPEVDAMIVALGGNDLLRGFAPAVSKANLAGILEVAEKHDIDVLLVGMEAPGNYGPDYKAAFDAIYPDLAVEYGTMYVDSFFKGVGDVDPADIEIFMQADRLHPNAEGVALIVEGLGPDVEALIALAGES